MNIKNINKLVLASVVLCSLFFVRFAHAATLYIAPSSSNVSVGSTFTVAVRTDTKGERVNVAEATVSFSSDKLQVISASPGKTFTLQTPGSPSKSKTKVFFSAGLPAPGYKGTSGTLGNITFKAIAVGNADISILSGKVLLNDGSATDVLSGTSSSVIAISTPEIINTPSNSIAPLPEQPTQVNQNITNTVEQPVELQPTQSALHLSDNVYTTTITITVEDLIHILYALGVIIILLLGGIVYLLVVNSKLRRNK